MTAPDLEGLTPYGVLPDNDNDLPFAASAVYAGRGGTLRFRHHNGRDYAFPSLADGELVRLPISRLYAEGTTAAELTAYAGPVPGLYGRPAAKPGAPRHVYAAARTDTTLTFFWDPPAGVAAADVYYQLGLGVVRNPAFTAATVSGANRYTFTGLTPDTAYTLRIRAVRTPGGPGGLAAAGVVGLGLFVAASTQPAVDAVTGLTVSDVGFTALASWDAIDDPSPDLIYYELGWGPVADGDPDFTAATDYATLEYLLGGLSPLTEHVVRVRAVRAAAAGIVRGPADSTTFTTPSADGSAPDYWAEDYWDADYWG